MQVPHICELAYFVCHGSASIGTRSMLVVIYILLSKFASTYVLFISILVIT